MLRRQRPVWADCPLPGFASAWLLLLAGCGLGYLPGTGPDESPAISLLSAPAGTPASAYPEIEPNNSFETATPIALDGTGEARVTARLDDDDVDLFDLGAAGEADQFTITVDPSPGLALSVALFDDKDDLLQLVRHGGTGGAAYYFDLVCREATPRLRILVAGLDGAPATGEYALTVQRRAGSPFQTAPQVIVLDFDGDPAVSIAGSRALAVPTFDASRIDPRFAGQTAAIRQKVLAAVRAQFEGLQVTIRSSDESGAAASVHSSIHFGTYNPDLLGLADNVDPYNSDPSQAAIVFTDTFSLFSPLHPSADEMAYALANVASHEAGHLLGLWHVSDPDRLMDITATARQMLRRQTFGRAPLHPSVLPIGWQSDADLLAWAVGGALKVDTSTRRVKAEMDEWRRPIDFRIDRRWLSTCVRCEAVAGGAGGPG